MEPSSWFRENWATWQKTLQDWRKLQIEANDNKKTSFKDLGKKIDVDAKKASNEVEEREERADGDVEGDGELGNSETEIKPMEIDEEELDVFGVQNITDMGNGRPLFISFVHEDWALLSLRYEFHLLVHAFRHDVNDPDRPSFDKVHLPFYYNKYYKKSFNCKNYGVSSIDAFVSLIQDAASINEETSFLEAVLPEETPLEQFVKLTEEHRRERQRCIDAGDETACLKFTRPTPPPPRQKGGGISSQRASAAAQSRTFTPRSGGCTLRSYPESGGSRGPALSTPRSYGSSQGQKRYYAPPPPSPCSPSKQARYGSGGPQRGYPPPPPHGGYGSRTYSGR